MVANNSPSSEPPTLWQRIRASVIRGPVVPKTDQERAWLVLNNVLLHLHPPALPRSVLRFTHTWGLGGMGLVLLTLLAASGILTMFVYEPVPGEAYESIQVLQEEVLFGQFVRNIHYWSANLLLLVVGLHLLRVYFTGAFHKPRQFNWVIGLLLLAGVLLSSFTGYLLPWDQLSFWAITICVSMLGYVPGVGTWLQEVIRGGKEIGPATLLNFYTLHTSIVPASLVLLMTYHFWKVRKAGGVVLPRSADEATAQKSTPVLTVPHLVLRELVVGLVLTASVLLLAVLFDAPLHQAANPGMSPNPAKAPWYFLGFQELLMHFHPLIAVLVLPVLLAMGLLLLPYLHYKEDTAGVWFVSRKGRRMALTAALAALVATPLWVVLDEFLPDWISSSSSLPRVLSSGLIPAALCLAAVVAFHLLLKRRYGAHRGEAVQATFVLLLVAFVVLTTFSLWFRGEGMALVWPWELGT